MRHLWGKKNYLGGRRAPQKGCIFTLSGFFPLIEKRGKNESIISLCYTSLNGPGDSSLNRKTYLLSPGKKSARANQQNIWRKGYFFICRTAQHSTAAQQHSGTAAHPSQKCSMISGAGPPFHRRDFRGRVGGVGSYTLIGNVGCSCAFGLGQTKRGSAVEDPTPEIMEIAVVVCMGPGPRSMGGNI